MRQNGDLAQLARAPALQAGGRGFEAHILHKRIFRIHVSPSVKNVPRICALYMNLAFV